MLVVLALLTATDPEVALRQAEQSLKELDFKSAAADFEKACAADPCSRAQVLRTQVGFATALSSLGQSARAAEAFKRLLFVSPDWQLPQGASPRLRDPFEAAQVFWRSRAQAALTLKSSALAADEPGTLTARLEADPLSQVQRLVVIVRRDDREEQLEPSPGGRTSLSDRGFDERFELPATLTRPGTLSFVAQALSPSGSVLLESAPLERHLTAAAVTGPSTAPVARADPPAASRADRAVLHISVKGVFDAVSRQLGAEALLGVAVTRVLDVALGATLGANVGLRAAVTLHLPRTYRLSPFGQLRLGLHPTAGPAAGGGLAVGATLEAGPGRVMAMFAAELFSAPSAFAAVGALFFLGYELDLPGLRAD